MDDKSFNIRVPKKWARVGMIVMVTALIVVPLTAIATHSFTDVPDSNTFHSDIEWMKASGVTKGCNPPANTQYCPDDNVTRGQMAAFMNRFAGYLGAVDGTPAQADNATTADSATTADDADTLDGVDSTDILSKLPVATIYMDLPGDIKFAEGIEEVTNPSTGIYCLRLANDLGLLEEDVYAQVTVEWGDSSGDDLLAYWQASNGVGCPDADQVEIRTYDFPGGTPALSDDIAFVATLFQEPEGNSVTAVSSSSDTTGPDNNE